ncbi:peptidase C39 family protein [Deinococcus cellulosilyticus]|uniref:Peptidase C39 n=1 Tax=Deinococcus cellulosilyticus (strain DSM 18568 / NBRC 106333 / KACC 11606 / 5516J-15) TaxID=1223518 RepID=A0A511N0L3_DEIC1|nr:peptidase C39 family protein [Deinococcus cellulosilyticus]GEM46420.1 peptidase C39 [Deinococcus cellulosilyticus NBRC 106333 = KACC 11606]
MNLKILSVLVLLTTMTATAKTTLQTFSSEAFQTSKLQQVTAGPVVRLSPAQKTGTLESAEIAVPAFDTLILSWNAKAPVGTQVRLEARVFTAGHWSRYYTLGIWSEDEKVRQSVNGQKDSDGRVLTDTLKLTSQGTKYQYRVTFQSSKAGASPELRNISVMTSSASKPGAYTPNKTVWGKVLDVPLRSQMIYPDGGEAWCSPTSTSMVMKYYGIDLSVPEAAQKTYDPAYDGTGNWVFNTALAGSHGLNAYVTRLEHLGEAEQWISKNVPVIISMGWKKGELPGAPLPQSSGHLMVIVGFDKNGNVVMNDPAGKDDTQVRRTYNRAILEKLWLEHSGGTAYIIQKP